ncbi:hypothetical protein [Amycolatopsis sp. WQ 127309]|uniref:hypothetical protein n=1 Tax=Amycolatopsis sp. WQ 127309 TaxID=2932773 RepID=UPI001FF51946|nr:hypothetical protein [Amycolatopsis sp. WQ 127309]UOZ03658.1 hypothetical protein MUY22_33020 [Amycolatopsis sp. WQ 127309]
MRNGSDDATSGDSKARGARTAFVVLAFVAAGLGVSQAVPGGAPVAAGAHPGVHSGAHAPAGSGSGEGPNH